MLASLPSLITQPYRFAVQIRKSKEQPPYDGVAQAACLDDYVAQTWRFLTILSMCCAFCFFHSKRVTRRSHGLISQKEFSHYVCTSVVCILCSVLLDELPQFIYEQSKHNR